MHSLRSQLILSHLLLVLLMGLVMSVTSVGFFTITRSVDHVLKGNFESIQAAHEMTDGLHEEETAYALYATGDFADARTTFMRASGKFHRAYKTALHTVTAANQKTILSAVGRGYDRLSRYAEEFFGDQTNLSQAKALTDFQTYVRP